MMAMQEPMSDAVELTCHERKTMQVSTIWVFLKDHKLSNGYVFASKLNTAPEHIHVALGHRRRDVVCAVVHVGVAHGGVAG
jgi:hypothetical protein